MGETNSDVDHLPFIVTIFWMNVSPVIKSLKFGLKLENFYEILWNSMNFPENLENFP